MTSFLDSQSGILNNAGYQSVAGRGLYSTDEKNQNIIDERVGIELPWLQGPSPETLFKLSSKPNPSSFFKEEKCPPSFHTSIQESVNYQTVVAPQRGYKTRGFTENNLRGLSAIENIANKAVQDYLILDESEEPSFIIDNTVVNDEAAAFKYGKQENPPDYGLRLPGSLSTLMKSHTPGKLITTHKREGYAPSGYYAGYNSAKTNKTGVMDPQVQ